MTSNGYEAPFWHDGEVLQLHYGDRGITPNKLKAIDLHTLNGIIWCVNSISINLLQKILERKKNIE